MSYTDTEIKIAEEALSALIKKSRAHMYKPIQIAEILYRDRAVGDITLDDVETYRKESKKWRDKISRILVGNIATSSAKYQDNLFDENALPPNLISVLGDKNRKTQGAVEKYIYSEFRKRFADLKFITTYAASTHQKDFSLSYFINGVEEKPGLRRSIDKVYEIVVYSLFEVLIEQMEIYIKVSVKEPQNIIFSEFRDFSDKIFGSDFPASYNDHPARLFRVGVANAADRGLDMWGNFGLAIQIKHLTLSEDMAESIADGVSADRIVIVCKDAEEKIIISILNQLGWKGRIQSVITLQELIDWYDKAMKGNLADRLGPAILEKLVSQIGLEFPMVSQVKEVEDFFHKRNY